MGTFSTDIFRQIKGIHEKMNVVPRKIGLMLFTNIQQRTPVDQGTLRKSWTVSLNGYPSNYNGSNQAISQAKYNDLIVIATNQPYAPVVEYGLYPNPPKKPTGKTKGGYSVQAPTGMVRISVQEMKSYLARNPSLGL